jgi:hypothetical protein
MSKKVKTVYFEWIDLYFLTHDLIISLESVTYNKSETTDSVLQW